MLLENYYIHTYLHSTCMLVAEFVKYMEQREVKKKILIILFLIQIIFSLVRKMVQINNFDIIKRNSNCFDTSSIKKLYFENRNFIIFESFEA